MRKGPAQEQALDRYRDAVASLHQDGALVGHLATRVESFRGLFSFRRQGRVWLLLTRVDGSREPIQEDYPPWSYMPGLQEGRLDWTSPDGDVQYEVRWLQGEERRGAWDRFGVVDDIGAYGGGSQ